MFESVLVANRGEIAVRIIRTLRRLGIRSIAVYSDADTDAPHVRLADVAVRLGPAPARDSYLDVGAIVTAARDTDAQAVHPGYGFLSESSALASACESAGIVFVGPAPAALELMGDKIRAKRHVAARGVPVIPGVSEPGLDDAALLAAAETVGFPLLVKPSAGGGGKGMQRVEHPDDLASALATARRVAKAAFGDDELLLERWIHSPRHIEVQVLADAHGGIVHLGERECSLQRRHQKVIEEAPSPLLDAATRERMGEAACEVARGADYTGAGTVEFLVSAEAPGEFFFMEMNARLQVEHPVTEEVARVDGHRVDLVEQQLRIAAGEHLSFEQASITLEGHAIEARVYAEDPARDFLPATGAILALDEPSGDGIRVDSGLALGCHVTADYDPMLAKVIGCGRDRSIALRRLDRALVETVVLGVHHNVEFLRALLAEPAVQAGELDTGIIERMLPAHDFGVPSPATLESAADLLSTPTGAGPWHRRDGWRLGEHRPVHVTLEWAAGQRASVEVPASAPEPTTTAIADGTLWIADAGAAFAIRVVTREEQLAERLAALDRPAGSLSPDVHAPMPGTVVAISAETGDTVTAGQPLVTIEAMKMEQALTAPLDGIATIEVRVGDLVRLDQVVARVAAPSDSAPAAPEHPPAAASAPATSTGGSA